MRIDSPHWDRELGVCTKHSLPSVPCPACLSGEGDEDLEFTVTESDEVVVEFGDAESLADLVPKNLREGLLSGRFPLSVT